MMTSGQLFWIRLKQSGREQLRAWNSVLDWTVWLYLLIPGLFILGGLYREVWLDTPDWAFRVPWLTLFPIALFILLLLGRVRIFVEEADRLFLLQRPDWMQALKVRGIFYTFVIKAFMIVIPHMILLPFLIKAEGLTLLQISLAYSFTFIMGMVLALSLHILQGRWNGWFKWTAEAVCLILFAVLYLFPMLAWAEDMRRMLWCLAAGVLMLGVLLLLAIHSKLQFEAEVKNETSARLRSTELLMSQVVESKPIIRFKRPVFFRRSQRIFRQSDAGTMLAEMRLKAFLRGMTHIRVWISFIFATAYAVTLVPGPVALFLIAALSMLGISWLQLQWKQWFAEEFIAQYKWSEKDVWRGAWLSRFWLLLPPLLIWSAIGGYKLGGLWAAVIAILVCGAVWRAVKK